MQACRIRMHVSLGRIRSLISATLISWLLPAFASAHEVYILSEEEIRKGLAAEHINPLSVIHTYEGQFILWTFIVIIVLFSIFFISISRTLENRLDPFLNRLKHYAPFIARLTFGVALISAGYYGALFGPELPLSELFAPALVPLIRGILIIIGVLAVFGLYARSVGTAAIAIFGIGVAQYGTYMLTYANYLGEMLVLLLVGPHKASVERVLRSKHGTKTRVQKAHDFVYRRLAKYSFLILRVAFGISLIYASWYAKFLHSDLAMQAVMHHHLDTVFGFEPAFLVLGAAIIEMLLGVLFILGIEIRFASMFLSVFLLLSLIYFGEVVWPHIILFGVAAALFAYGYDKYSLEGRFFKEGGREPIF